MVSVSMVINVTTFYQETKPEGFFRGNGITSIIFCNAEMRCVEMLFLVDESQKAFA